MIEICVGYYRHRGKKYITQFKRGDNGKFLSRDLTLCHSLNWGVYLWENVGQSMTTKENNMNTQAKVRNNIYEKGWLLLFSLVLYSFPLSCFSHSNSTMRLLSILHCPHCYKGRHMTQTQGHMSFAISQGHDIPFPLVKQFIQGMAYYQARSDNFPRVLTYQSIKWKTVCHEN